MKTIGQRPRAFWRRWWNCNFGSHYPNRYGRCRRCGAVVTPLSVVVERLRRERER